MKRIFFVIDDKLSDVSGILFSLQAVLRQMSREEPETLSDTSIAFCHICWGDIEDTQRENQDFFNRARDNVIGKIKECHLTAVEKIEYFPIVFESGEYSQDALPKMAERVIDTQRKSVIAFCGDGAKFPNVDGNAFSYAVLLDIVLNLNKDCDHIQQKERVLSNELYDRLPDSRCIVFTNYDEGGITENWMKLSNVTAAPIQRQLISRAQGIYLPFKNRIYQAFGIE